MRPQLMLALALACTAASPAVALDTLFVRKIHTDAYAKAGKEVPAEDTTQTVWMTKDRMRVETTDMTMLVRLDQQKMYLLDAKEKVATVIELPFDMKKYVPAEMVPMIEKNAPKATVTATDEQKKIGSWNARKYTVSIASPVGMSSNEEVWVTKDLKLDYESYKDMSRQVLSMAPGGNMIAEEMKKLDGVPVLTLRTRNMGGTETRMREELASMEEKDAPAGTFDVPSDYTQKPFNPMAEMQRAPMMKK